MHDTTTVVVRRYMQITQKHPRFAMQYFDIKNKKGTPLTLGVNQHGLAVYRHSKMQRPVVSFSWAECSELAFTDKKFTIQVQLLRCVSSNCVLCYCFTSPPPPRKQQDSVTNAAGWP